MDTLSHILLNVEKKIVKSVGKMGAIFIFLPYYRDNFFIFCHIIVIISLF